MFEILASSNLNKSKQMLRNRNYTLPLNGHTSFEFQTRNYVTCFGHICNHSYGQENHTQKYINMVLITV